VVLQFCDKTLKKQILGDIWILVPHLGDKALKKKILGTSFQKKQDSTTTSVAREDL
jgi:hypothetical protein